MLFTQPLVPIRLNNIRQTPNSLHYLAQDDDIRSGEYNHSNIESYRGRSQRNIVDYVAQKSWKILKINVVITRSDVVNHRDVLVVFMQIL